VANLVVHFEIHASEPQRLVDFYSGLLGWKFTQFGDTPYWTIETGEGAIGNVAGTAGHGINGGLTQRRGPKPEPGAPVMGCNFVVGVDDVDTLMARGVDLGGTVALSAEDMQGVGRSGYLLDPDSNVFGMISAVMSDGTIGMGGGVCKDPAAAEKMTDPASRMPGEGEPTSMGRLTRAELADLVGDSVERIQDLSARGVIHADDVDLYSPGDAHRIRVIDGFEAAGVPLDVLVRAQAAGIISVDYYDQLHAAPGRPSERDYDAFKMDLGPPSQLLPAIFAGFGIAEPDPASHLSVEDEALIEDWAVLIDATGHAA